MRKRRKEGDSGDGDGGAEAEGVFANQPIPSAFREVRWQMVRWE